MRKNARDSGYPESRPTTLDDELYEETGAKPQTARTTTLPTNMFEIRMPESIISVSKSNERNPNIRFASQHC